MPNLGKQRVFTPTFSRLYSSKYVVIACAAFVADVLTDNGVDSLDHAPRSIFHTIQLWCSGECFAALFFVVRKYRIQTFGQFFGHGSTHSYWELIHIYVVTPFGKKDYPCLFPEKWCSDNFSGVVHWTSGKIWWIPATKFRSFPYPSYPRHFMICSGEFAFASEVSSMYYGCVEGVKLFYFGDKEEYHYMKSRCCLCFIFSEQTKFQPFFCNLQQWKQSHPLWNWRDPFSLQTLLDSKSKGATPEGSGISGEVGIDTPRDCMKQVVYHPGTVVDDAFPCPPHSFVLCLLQWMVIVLTPNPIIVA